MKKLHYSIVLSAAILSSANTSAQVSFNFDPAGLSSYSTFDNLARSSMQDGHVVSNTAVAMEIPFWIQQRFGMTYQYENTRSKLASGAKLNTHTINPDIYLVSKKRLILELDFSYLRGDREDLIPTQTDVDVFSFSMALNQVLTTNLFKKPTMVVIGAVLGYGATDLTTTTPIGPVTGDTDTFVVAPNLALRHTVSESSTLWLIPSYVFSHSTAKSTPGTLSDTHTGVLGLQGRADLKFNDHVFIPSVTWRHDVNQKTAVGTTVSKEDWAEFGLTYQRSLSDAMNLRFGYSYEAFHPAYETHSLQAVLQLGF